MEAREEALREHLEELASLQREKQAAAIRNSRLTSQVTAYEEQEEDLLDRTESLEKERGVRRFAGKLAAKAAATRTA